MGGPERWARCPAGSAPTEAEYDEAHELYHDLAEALDEAGAAAADYQTAVKKAHESDPDGFRDSAELAAAMEEQQAAVDAREAALAELAEHPAMADEELAAAYERFTTGYAEAMAYQGGYNESYPAFLESGHVCAGVFESGPEDAPTFTAYARKWLQLQQRAARPCLEVTDELAASGNEDVVAIADRWVQLVDERTAAIRRMANGSASSDRTLAAIERLNEAFIDAIDAIFEDRVGETDAPSEEPSDAPSEEE